MGTTHSSLPIGFSDGRVLTDVAANQHPAHFSILKMSTTFGLYPGSHKTEVRQFGWSPEIGNFPHQFEVSARNRITPQWHRLAPGVGGRQTKGAKSVK